MKNLIRAVGAAVIIAAAAVAIHELCILPLRCSTVEYAVERSTFELLAHEGGASVPQHARENLKTMRQCMSIRPTDVNIYMIAAINSRLLGDYQEAADFYKQALRYDQRPELFVNLGNMQSALGQRSDAVENLVKANIFWPGNGDEIEDPFVHQEVMRRVKEYELEIKRRQH